MNKRYPVRLTPSERDYLRQLVAAGTETARKLTHARILLKADQGEEGPAWVDERIAEAVEVSQPTVSRVRKAYEEEGLEAAINRRPPSREYRRKLDGEQEAHLIAVACAAPPKGQARWSLRLLAGKLVELEVVESVSYQTVRRTLKKTNRLAGRQDYMSWLSPRGSHAPSCFFSHGVTVGIVTIIESKNTHAVPPYTAVAVYFPERLAATKKVRAMPREMRV